MVTFLAYSSVFQEYAKRGAYAYVSMIQREERKNKVHGGFVTNTAKSAETQYRGTFSKSTWHYKKVFNLTGVLQTYGETRCQMTHDETLW